jgi:hypothetical protein
LQVLCERSFLLEETRPPSDHPLGRVPFRTRRTRTRFAPPKSNRTGGRGEGSSPRSYNRERCSRSNRRSVLRAVQRNRVAYATAFRGPTVDLLGSRLHYWLTPPQVPTVRDRDRSLYRFSIRLMAQRRGFRKAFGHFRRRFTRKWQVLRRVGRSIAFCNDTMVQSN